MLVSPAMSSLGFPLQVLVLWGCSSLVQLVVLVLLFKEGSFRKLSSFTVYTALNICQVGFLLFVYGHGFGPKTTETLAWFSEAITLVAQSFAATEILQVVLRPYQGIWGLAWRLLAFTAIVVIVLYAKITYPSWSKAAWFELDVCYHLTFAIAMLGCLLLIRYYSIPVPKPYKTILIGFCFCSCADLLINKVFRPIFYLPGNQNLWRSATMLSFIVVLLLWAVALWKPLPAENPRLAASSDDAYQRLSPEINDRLRLLNEKLQRLWKLEAGSN
jgi:hypothetical protein